MRIENLGNPTPDELRYIAGIESDGVRIARLEGRMDRLEDKLSVVLKAGPIVAAFALGWMVAR